MSSCFRKSEAPGAPAEVEAEQEDPQKSPSPPVSLEASKAESAPARTESAHPVKGPLTIRGMIVCTCSFVEGHIVIFGGHKLDSRN